ncbi:DMT family transporter [Actinoplanes sp. NPDC051851]|uniref:DMT family transporter n=1 Tax=Actinoplanes sp. NPDC051851 TaxID=3154753 RepID=UPI003417B5B5
MQLTWLRRPGTLMVITSAPTYVATGELLRVISPLDLTPVRFLGAALVIGLFLLIRRRPLTARRGDLVRVFVVSAIGYAVYGTLLNLGQTTVPAGTTSLLLNTSPVFALILGHLLLGERITRRGVAGTVVATAGVAMVAVFGGGRLGLDWNALIILVAALILALYLIRQQPLLSRIPATEMVFWGCLWGGLLTLPLAPFDLRLGAWTGRTWIALAVLVVVSTVLAYSFWALSLAETSVAEGGSLLFAVPLFSITLGWLLLDQVPSPAAILGGCIAVAGVMLVSRSAAASAPPVPRPRSPAAAVSPPSSPAPVEEDVVDLAIPAIESAAIEAAVGRAVDRVGARLATVSLWRPGSRDLVRVYTSMPEVYRPGGVSAGLGDDWIEQCVVRQESYLADDPGDLASDAFEHHGTLAALRLGAAINAVVVHDGRFLGCLNLLHSPGSYTPDDLHHADAAAADLAEVLSRLT